MEAEALDASAHKAHGPGPFAYIDAHISKGDALERPALRLTEPAASAAAEAAAPRGASMGAMGAMAWWRWALPVAACIGLAAFGTRFASYLLAPTPLPSDGFIAGNGLTPGSSAAESGMASGGAPTVHASADSVPDATLPYNMREASLVMSVSLDESTNCRCTQTVLHQWSDDRPLQSISRDEMLRVGLESSCLPSPDRMLIIVVSGPLDQLPRSVQAQLQLASCVDLTDEDDPDIDDLDLDDFSHDEGKYAAYAQICLGEGLSVEAVALRIGR